MTDSGSNLLDDSFEETLVHKLASNEHSKIKKVICEYLNELKNEKVCEYDPTEFNKDPSSLLIQTGVYVAVTRNTRTGQTARMSGMLHCNGG